MTEKYQLPLQQLYDPIMIMFQQIEGYELLFQELESRQKESRKNKFIIEKLIAMQDKKQQLEKEKIEFDTLYQKSNLTREQHKHLISQEIEIDQEFYQIFKILDEQENLTKELINYDDPQGQGPSQLRGSLTENIDIIRSAALSKIIAHLKKHYEMITIDELKDINKLFQNKVNDQIIFVLRYKFSNLLIPLLAGINSMDEQSIISFFKTLDSQIQQSFNQTEEIFDKNASSIFPQIIDNICCDYAQQLDATLKFVESYFLFYEVNIQIQQIINFFKSKNTQLQFNNGLIKLLQLCSSQKIKSVQFMSHNLQVIRFNIAQFSSYQPLKDQLYQMYDFLKKNKPEERQEILCNLWQPFQQLIQMKLNQNSFNRSSKIFSINALQIYINQLQEMKILEIQDTINNYIKECQQLLGDLIQKLKIENITESAQKFKVQQREKNIQLSKDQFKKFLRQIVQLDENGFRNDLFFEIDLIINEQIKSQIQIDIAETFTKEYYEPLYENLFKYLSNSQNEFTTEVIQQLCLQYSVTVKDIYKIPVYIRDPASYKLNIMNFQSL
ncbi:unnamed protein product [Paramecium pentaurelia]|uniref:Uncharacterized protein n=1 Tax=Paramecium pentaurelia TaxID=43138 RepID=A0A8S1TXI5_9CILI|nr:unnamed protein product [Paramecium pentaurelia]